MCIVITILLFLFSYLSKHFYQVLPFLFFPSSHWEEKEWLSNWVKLHHHRNKIVGITSGAMYIHWLHFCFNSVLWWFLPKLYSLYSSFLCPRNGDTWSYRWFVKAVQNRCGTLSPDRPLFMSSSPWSAIQCTETYFNDGSGSSSQRGLLCAINCDCVMHHYKLL